MKVDLRDRKWDKIPGYIPSVNPLVVGEYVQKESKKLGWQCLCDSSSSCWIQLGKRIGSESNAGMVFGCSFPAHPSYSAVAKVMPQDKDGNWKREVEIASFLSSKKSNYFPIVYAVIQNSKVFLPSYGNPISKYRSKGEGSSGSNEKENKIPPRSSKHTCHDNVIMISERAWGDLKQLATFLSHSDIAPDAQIDIWLDILAQIEDAICALHLLGILHDDLHTGNVLVNPVKDKTGRIEFKIKLHDFGQSRAIDPEDPLDARWDIQQIINELGELVAPLVPLVKLIFEETNQWTPSKDEPCFSKRYVRGDIEREKKKQEALLARKLAERRR